LVREGLFGSEVSGRQKYFQLNREYPIFDEVRKIITKTIGAAPLITQTLKRIHHIAIIDFVRSRIDKKHSGLLAVFDRLRRKRNMALSDDTGLFLMTPSKRSNQPATT
jgi:hypothetical protein